MSEPAIRVVVAALPEPLVRGRERVAEQGRAAREAARASARISGAPPPELVKDAEDVPLPSHGWHWSVSHSLRSVAGAVARAPIGIDVEDAREVSDGVVGRVLSDGEALLLGTRDRIAFLRAWTAKEAWLKELGRGLAGGLGRCRIAGAAEDWLDLELDGARRRVRQLVERTRVASASCGLDAPIVFVITTSPIAAAAP